MFLELRSEVKVTLKQYPTLGSPKMCPIITYGNSASNNIRDMAPHDFLELKPEVKVTVTLKLRRPRYFKSTNQIWDSYLK